MTRNVAGILLSLAIAALIFFLGRPLGALPAIGAFFSPTHGFWNSATQPEYDNRVIELEAINGKATIVYDSLGIPHIFADDPADLLYAQGYAEAQNRLWQMDFITRVADGRIAEVVGEKALELDRFHRRIGLPRAARTCETEMLKDKTSKMVLEAFSAGVNAWIDQLRDRDLPVEYKLLGYKPEPWAPYKCALLMKYMAKDLTYYDTDIEHTNALRLFGRTIYDKLYPDFPSPEDPIIPAGTTWNFTSVDTSGPMLGAADNNRMLYPNPLKALYSPPFLGSNNWAVAGSKTASGKPILCNDPHLQLNLPSIWIIMHLVSNDLNVMGATIPGAPGIISGFNEHIAWGVTNAERDVTNTFSVEYNKDKTAYKWRDGYEPFTYEVHTIKVKGAPDFTDSVRMTKVGAVVYDENFGDMPDQKHLAVYWRATEPSNDLKTFYGLDHAKNYADYLAALQYYSCPGQNFVYADRDNNIAIRQQGYFMLRTQTDDGSFVTPLALADVDRLKQKIPVEQNPYVLNPERGFVSSANQKPVDKTYPYLTNGVYENLRNRVINDVLGHSSNIQAKDMMKLQDNNLSLVAKETLPAMLAYLDEKAYSDPLAKQMIAALKSWNFYTDAQLEAPSYFYKWLDEAENTAWDEFDRKDVSMIRPQIYVFASLLANDPQFPLFDIEKTAAKETAQEVANLAFQKTVEFFKKFREELPDTKWVTYKNTSVMHLARLDAFSVKGINIGGYNNIVNATSEFHGPSWRMVVDFGTGKPTAYGIYPGGQNGNPASDFYNNMIPVWAGNNYYTLGFYKDKAEAMKGIKELKN